MKSSFCALNDVRIDLNKNNQFIFYEEWKGIFCSSFYFVVVVFVLGDRNRKKWKTAIKCKKLRVEEGKEEGKKYGRMKEGKKER